MAAAIDVPQRRSAIGAEAMSSAAWLLAAALALWAVMCGAGALLTHQLHDTAVEDWDGSVNRWFADRRSPAWNGVTQWMSYAAETVTVCLIGLAMFVVLRLCLHRWRESVFLAVALIGEVTIFVGTTAMIDRQRPAVSHLDAAPPTSSFPSGHTGAAVVLFGGLAVIAVRVVPRAWVRALAIVVAVLLATAVAVARVYRGMHFPTDVIAGAVLGLVWLAVTATVILFRPGVPRVPAAPEPGPAADAADRGRR